MKVGFTGTRKGTTFEQYQALCGWLSRSGCTEAHDGNCVGADSEFALAVSIVCPTARTVAHPCSIWSLQDKNRKADEFRPVSEPLVRNRNIVNEVDVLVACPKGMDEEQQSGTWSCVRHARKQKKRIVVIWPDGLETEENGPQLPDVRDDCRQPVDSSTK